MDIRCVVNDSLTAMLSLQPIDNLIAAARDGFRLYELFRLNGPADLIHYVDIEVVADAPEALSWWPSGMGDEQRPQRWRGDFESPPWTLFGGDSSEIRNAWAHSGADVAAPDLASARWPEIETARATVRSSADPFIVFELALIDGDDHPNDHGLREPDISQYLQRYFRFLPRRYYPDSAYPLIADLLAHPAITAFTHRGRGDWYAIKLACAEQARRCGGIPPGQSELFPVRVLTPWSGSSCADWDDGHRISLDPYPAWTRGVRWQFEGLQIQGLFLDEGGCGAEPIASGEYCQLREGLAVVLTNYEGEDKSPLREWYRHSSGLFVGVAPEARDQLAPLFNRHFLLE